MYYNICETRERERNGKQQRKPKKEANAVAAVRNNGLLESKS